MNKFQKRLSELINYVKQDKIRQRQLLAVACILGLSLSLYVYSSEESTLEEHSKETTEEVITVIEKTQLPNYSYPTAGINAELGKILREAEKESTKESTKADVEEQTIPASETPKEVKKEEKEPEPIRENTLYYVLDENITFNLDPAYQDYIWNKLKEYSHTELYKVCLAQAYHESRFELDVVSSTNDHGLMQINGGNYKWLHDTLDIDSLDDPYDNIDCGIYILVTNYEKYGTIEEALVAYNQGHCGEIKSTEYSQCILNHDMDCLYVLEIEETK